MCKFSNKSKRKDNYAFLRGHFKVVLYDTDGLDDIDNKWMAMVKEFDLSKNSWMKYLFENKNRWVLTYICDTF